MRCSESFDDKDAHLGFLVFELSSEPRVAVQPSFEEFR